jgi:hypothetical protein
MLIAQAQRRVADPRPNQPDAPAMACPVAAVGQGPVDIEESGFVASGWMGDAEEKDKSKNPLSVDLLNRTKPRTGPYSQQWSYKPEAGHEKGWVAVVWQCGANNWGEEPGKNWSKRGFTRITFWARGERGSAGRFPKIMFKAGGNTRKNGPHQASFPEISIDKVTLTENWQPYSIPLVLPDGRKLDLSQVVAGFVFSINAADVDPGGGVFYLDSIRYEP